MAQPLPEMRILSLRGQRSRSISSPTVFAILRHERSAVSARTRSREASAKHARSPNDRPACLVAGKRSAATKASSSSNTTRSIGRGSRTNRMRRCGRSVRQPLRDSRRSKQIEREWDEPFHPRLAEQQGQKGGGVENGQDYSRSASRRRSTRKASREASGFSPSSRRVSA